MAYQIIEHNLGEGAVQAYFYRSGTSAAFAVGKDLPPTHKRSRHIEGLANFIRPTRADERICFRASKAEHVDPLSVSCIGRLVEELEPDWVLCVKAACRYTNDVVEIAGECELELNAVVAIVRRLVAGGEIDYAGDAS